MFLEVRICFLRIGETLEVTIQESDRIDPISDVEQRPVGCEGASQAKG